MDQSAFPIRLVKGGFGFLGDEGRANFATDRVIVTRADQIVFSFSRGDVAKASKHPLTGVWTIKLTDDRTVAVAGMGPSKTQFNQRLHSFINSDKPTNIF